MPIDQENLELWNSLRTRAIFHLARPLAARGIVIYPGPLWAGFMRGSYSCSMADLRRNTGLNIFRRPVPKYKEKSLRFDFRTHSMPQPGPDWHELSALSSQRAAFDEELTVCGSNGWPAHLVAGGVEALIMGAPAVWRWRSARGKIAVVSHMTGARK